MSIEQPVHVKFKWWVMPFLALCELTVFFGIELDIDTITEKVISGTRVNGKVINGRRC